MKKILLAIALICGLTAQAQIKDDKNCFNHLSVGLGVGTTGIGFEVGTTVCPFITMRTGVDFMPGVSYTTSMDFDRPEGWYDIPQVVRRTYLPTDDITTDFKVSSSFVSGKLLFDIYTGKNSMFHFTVGAYFGSRAFATAQARGEVIYGVGLFNQHIDEHVAGIGTEKILLEGYELGVDKGRAKASARVNGFRPYVGIGVGRTTPRKRVGVKFELGAQFWGKPKAHDHVRGEDVTKDYPGISSDLADGLNIAGKIIAYPTLKVSVFGRIF